MTVRVRYAPSPTGSPHVGNLRTAIYDWLLARHFGGTFIARLEDTDRDPARYKPEAIGELEECLRFLEITPDEWWVSGGPSAPYLQSERLERYREVVDDLIGRGRAYRCWCTEDRLAQMRIDQQANGLGTGYDRHCRYLSDTNKSAFLREKLPYIVRLAMPLEGEVICHDAVFGDVKFDFKLTDDPVLLKSNGWPTYHLAAIVDDHDTRITHVLRGEEWLPSAPKHIHLYNVMSWDQPVWVHLPLILATDKKKLSKRHGSTQFTDFIDDGYLPEALFNFLALLGWSPGEGDQEVFSRDQIIERFSLDGITKHPAVFDYEKLNWMNGEYIRAASPERLIDLCVPFLVKDELISNPPTEEERAFVAKVLPLAAERIKLLSEIGRKTEFFFRDPQEPDDNGRKKWLVGNDAIKRIVSIHSAISALPGELTDDSAEAVVNVVAEQLTDGQRAPVIHLLRIAATGQTVGPGLFETLAVLGKERVLRRLEKAKSWVMPEGSVVS